MFAEPRTTYIDRVASHVAVGCEKKEVVEYNALQIQSNRTGSALLHETSYEEINHTQQTHERTINRSPYEGTGDTLALKIASPAGVHRSLTL
jgi:hypothetical protein